MRPGTVNRWVVPKVRAEWDRLAADGEAPVEVAVVAVGLLGTGAVLWAGKSGQSVTGPAESHAHEAKGQKLQMIDSTSVRVHQQAAAQKNRVEIIVSVEAGED